MVAAVTAPGRSPPQGGHSRRPAELADGVALRFHDVARVGDDLRVIARVERKG
jgi:hypothetical protein